MRFKQALFNTRRALYEIAGNPKYSRPALNHLDDKLARYLVKRNGFFIEAGANDGFTQSNTYFLEKMMGWSGILIEGIPQLYQQAFRRRKRSRVFNCALVPFGREGSDVEMIYGNLMSLVTGAMGDSAADAEHIRKAREHDSEAGTFSVKVPGRTLTSILDECGVDHIDFFSLDVEGFEGPVLQGLDLNRYRPEFLCVEARNRNQIDSLVSGHYQFVEHLSPMDVLYQSKY